MIYPDSFETKTGFDKVKAGVKSKCVTHAAAKKTENVKFLSNKAEIVRLLSLVAEMKTICLLDDTFPDRGYVDTDKFLNKIRTIGYYLEPNELLNLQTALKTIGQILLFFSKKGENEYPFLKKLVAQVNSLPAVVAQIDSIIDHIGKIKDNASPELNSIRKEIYSKQSTVSKRIQSILKLAQAEGIVDSESGVTMRDGHAVIPVLAINKRKIKGLVVGESATGRTVFIEPMEVVELNNSIRELEFAEQREIVKILVAMSDFLRPYYEDISFAGEIISEIDFIRAKAYYAIEINAGIPIITDELQINLIKARHPVLMQALARENKKIVPLDVNLNTNQRILLISGPNAGGKSVCIKTAGLVQYMMQCGFLIPASEVSEMGIFKKIFIDIGDEQSLENDLSTYSSHLTNMKFFMKNADKATLILIDEFGTGTEPSAGGAIAESVLADLLNKQAFGMITTHYTNLKYFASSTESIINGAMLFDVQHIQPLFKLETGIPGNSFAFEIARKIGIPEDVLKNAESKLGNKQVKMEKGLREIARDKRYWETKRDRIRKTDKYLEELTDKYEKELSEIKETRRKLINEAKEEAKKILANVNKEIENTIKIIKESQANKEETKIARNKLESLKENINNDFVDSGIEQKMQKIKARQEQKKNKKEIAPEPENNEIIEPILQEGDKVNIKGQAAIGEIISISSNSVSVAMGNIIMNITPDKVEKISQNAYKKLVKQNIAPVSSSSTLSVKRLNFKPVLDVRGQRTTDALEQVIAYIDEAMVLGMHEVRILHGKGTGILKEEIRKYLKTFGPILTFNDEQEELGGSGITVVQIN